MLFIEFQKRTAEKRGNARNISIREDFELYPSASYRAKKRGDCVMSPLGGRDQISLLLPQKSLSKS